MDKKETNSDTENWVLVNSCDTDEEAIVLNQTTDSDHESESSISIISGVTTPNECHSEQEAILNKDPHDQIEMSEKLSVSTRSSIEEIEISDEEADVLLPALVPLIEIDQPNSVSDEEEVENDDIQHNESNLTLSPPMEIVEVKTLNHFDSDSSVETGFGLDPTSPAEDSGNTREGNFVPIICPGCMIQKDNDSLPKQVDTVECGELDKQLQCLPKQVDTVECGELDKQLQCVMEVQKLADESRPILQYDLPPDDDSSWSANDSSSDYINEDTQIVTRSASTTVRQDGLLTAFSQNSVLIGAVFFFATALLKLYLLNDNIDISDHSALNYELGKLREKYQTVNMQYNQELSKAEDDENWETVVNFCNKKHSSDNKVEKCIHKRMSKISDKGNTKKKKITLEMRERLLTNREKELQEKEQELLRKLEKHKMIVHRFSDTQKSKRSAPHKNDQTNLNDHVLATIEASDPIEELAKRLYNTEISCNSKNVVTFKEIALALREKELVQKLHDYNNNLENQINEIVKRNRHLRQHKTGQKINSNYKENKAFHKKGKFAKLKPMGQKFSYDPDKFSLKKRKLNSQENKGIPNKAPSSYNKKKRKEDKNVKYNSKEMTESFLKSTNSEEKKDNDNRNNVNKKTNPEFENKRKHDNTYFKELQNYRDFDPIKNYKSEKHNLMRNFKKFKTHRDHDLKDELYIKYNPLKDLIDIVNISNSDDKNFILLENSNKTVNGQWYINLHHARSILRSRERSADWYFDRVLHRELKRNKAKWYFDYMNGRQHTRECFI